MGTKEICSECGKPSHSYTQISCDRCKRVIEPTEQYYYYGISVRNKPRKKYGDLSHIGDINLLKNAKLIDETYYICKECHEILRQEEPCQPKK